MERGQGAEGQPSDAVVSCREGVSDLESLVTTYYPVVYGYLGRRLGRQLAEELASETFAIACRDRDRYDESRGSPAAWLLAIATGLLAHHRRTERRRLAAYARLGTGRSEPDETAELALAHVSSAAVLSATARALRQMPARQRDALYLVAVAGLDYEETASVLSIPLGTVRSRIARARSRLRAEIEAVEDAQPPADVQGGHHAH